MNDLEKLLEIMSALRDPDDGCPWDLEQDFSTIAPYTVEEAYEVADAIARNDMPGLRDELGDLVDRGLHDLPAFVSNRRDEIVNLQGYELDEQEAHHLMIKSLDYGVIGYRELPKLISEWRRPTVDELIRVEPNAWGLFNAATSVIRPRFEKGGHYAQEAAKRTMRLTGMCRDLLSAEGVR